MERVVALSGGVGGAKLALGLYRVLPANSLSVIANPGDDFEHLGLTIWPDFDTLLYTLSGLAHPEQGWGRAGETGTFMAALKALGGEDWFFLGDGDLATHVERTRRLRAGQRPAEIARAVVSRLGIAAALLPASDQPVRTEVLTAQGPLAFQHYFVRERCRPSVTGFRFQGAEAATPSPEVLDALTMPGLAAIVICPSNPFISVDPMLAIPGFRAALRRSGAPIVAVSPIVGGQAIKGPTAKMLGELGQESSPVAIARHYGDLLTGIVLDEQDAPLAPSVAQLGIAVACLPTIMRSLAERECLAAGVLAFARCLPAGLR
ncbi:MAG: 2-phospho-L-lactate transferase [Alphaproteobacteria bacterium]|nr:2-phospho-L-lactate transferase [Alphaproteobacteria bacterium]